MSGALRITDGRKLGDTFNIDGIDSRTTKNKQKINQTNKLAN
jgi:hypothetical protein